MRNPPIVRAVISDVRGDVLFDSAAPQYARRLESVRPVIVHLARLEHKPEIAALSRKESRNGWSRLERENRW
jgi:hypothetical protein